MLAWVFQAAAAGAGQSGQPPAHHGFDGGNLGPSLVAMNPDDALGLSSGRDIGPRRTELEAWAMPVQMQ